MSENLEKPGAGYYLGNIAKIVLAAAMLLYLGLHSFNFFMFTFKGDQWIFAILGLFTTSIGCLDRNVCYNPNCDSHRWAFCFCPRQTAVFQDSRPCDCRKHIGHLEGGFLCWRITCSTCI